MNRRQFLTRALASVPVVLAGEQLAELLLPKRTIFLPPRGGWGGRSTLELLQAYCDRMRPAGVRVDCRAAAGIGDTTWMISEYDVGHLGFTIPTVIHPSLDRSMRRALLGPTPLGPLGTLASLTPWDERHPMFYRNYSFPKTGPRFV